MASPLPPQPTSVTMNTVESLCRHLAKVSVEESFGLEPYEWQVEFGARLNMMTSPASGVPPAPVFLNRPTGGGKSLCRDSFAASQGGVTWTISPLLSLAADQETKINVKAKQRENHRIFAIHLDNYRRPDEQRGISDQIKKLSKDSTTTVLVFSSPQVLRDSSVFYGMFKDSLDHSTLKLLVIDEAHLFAQFGLYFRNEFLCMKKLVFDLLARDGGKTTRIPVVFMTATATERILQQLEKMTGLGFDRQLNLHWPDPQEMMNRVQYIGFTMTDQTISEFKKVLAAEHERRGEGRRQWIYFSNSRTELESSHEKVKKHLNEMDYPGDIVMITGTMFKEQKFFYTNKFLNSTAAASVVDGEDLFDPIGCMATRGVGGAGWDGPNVHCVFSADFPPDICSLAQEKGRAGRRPESSPSTDSYHVCGSLKSIVHIIRRMYLPTSTTSESDASSTQQSQASASSTLQSQASLTALGERLVSSAQTNNDDYVASDKVVPLSDYRTMQYQDLLQVLSMFVLPTECFHVALERNLANPFSSVDRFAADIEPCKVACDFCLKSHKNIFPRIVHNGVKRALLSLFLGDCPMDKPTLDGALVESLRNYSNAQREFFASKAKGKPEPRTIKKLIVMLLTAEIITYRIAYDGTDTEKKNPIVLGRLNVDEESGSLCLSIASYWDRIPGKEALVG